jgi:beta-glucanase (GH16 family)
MKSKLFFICCTVVCTISACSSFNKPFGLKEKNYGTPEHILKEYKLVWKDDFNGKTVDLTKWNYRAEGAKRNYATVSSKTISTDGKGNLVMKTIKEGDNQYFVGQLGTEGIFETKFGYFECRAKVNKTIGPHTAFWLQTPEIHNEENNPKKYGAEIDVFEYHLNTPDMVHHNIHWNGYTRGIHKQVGTKIYYPKIKEGFHIFGVEWTDKEYIFYVDGKETYRTSEAISHREQYLILSTELTGFGGNHLLGNYPDSILFDYVKAYKRN